MFCTCLPAAFCPQIEPAKTYSNLPENSVSHAIYLHDNVFLLAYSYGCLIEIRDLDSTDEIAEENRFCLADEIEKNANLINDGPED